MMNFRSFGNRPVLNFYSLEITFLFHSLELEMTDHFPVGFR